MNPLASELLHCAKKQNRKLNEAERELHRTVFQSFPPTLQVEPTNRCDQHCQTCARSYYNPEENPPGDFPKSLLESLDLPFAMAEAVLFGGYGEPLMGKNFKPLLGMASDYGCRTELISNGSHLDDEMVEFLCGMGLDQIFLSVDAASDVEMMSLRGITLSEILGKIEMLREVGGINAPTINFNMTLNINNLEHISPLVSLATSHNVSRIIVAHQKIYSHYQADHSVFLHRDYARQIFQEAAEQARLQQVFLSLPPLDGQISCHQPMELIVIDHTGRVQGCCSSLFGGGWPRLELGHIQEDDLLSMWNAPVMQQARAASYGNGDWPSPCSQCGFRVFEHNTHLRVLDREPGS